MLFLDNSSCYFSFLFAFKLPSTIANDAAKIPAALPTIFNTFKAKSFLSINVLPQMALHPVSLCRPSLTGTFIRLSVNLSYLFYTDIISI